jgi:hypothetical protein
MTTDTSAATATTTEVSEMPWDSHYRLELTIGLAAGYREKKFYLPDYLTQEEWEGYSEVEKADWLDTMTSEWVVEVVQSSCTPIRDED